MVREDRKSTRLNSSHSLHDALPIKRPKPPPRTKGSSRSYFGLWPNQTAITAGSPKLPGNGPRRSEEHTSELQSLPTRRSANQTAEAATANKGVEPELFWIVAESNRNNRRFPETSREWSEKIGRAHV